MDFKKAVFTAIFGLLGLSACMAQYTDTNQYDYVRPQNEKNPAGLINTFSIGFGTGGDYPYYGAYYVESPSIILSYENTIIRHFGPGEVNLGALASFKQIASNYEDYSNGFSYIQRWDYYLLGARLVYHLTDFPSRLIEPYAGLMIAYYLTEFKFSSNDPDYSEPGDPGHDLLPNKYPSFFSPSIFAGVRSRFSNRGSTWLEAGYGYTSIAFGLSYKI
jgi:hypothetical protein